MKKHNFESVVELLEETLISENSERAKQLDHRRDVILREFRTVGFSAGRQSGRTEWILDRVGTDTASSLVIFPTENIKVDFEQRFLRKYKDSFESLRTIKGSVGNRGYTDRFRKGQIKYVYLDVAKFYFSKYGQDKLYQDLLTNFDLAEDVIIYLVF